MHKEANERFQGERDAGNTFDQQYQSSHIHSQAVVGRDTKVGHGAFLINCKPYYFSVNLKQQCIKNISSVISVPVLA